MNLDTIDYQTFFVDLLTQVIARSLLFGSIGFFLSILVIFFLFQKKWLKRGSYASQFFTYLLVFFWSLGAGVSGCSIGFAVSSKNIIMGEIQTKILPFMENTLPVQKQILVQTLDSSGLKDKLTLKEAIDKITNSSFLQDPKNLNNKKVPEWVNSPVGKLILTTTLTVMVKYSLKLAGDELGLPDEAIEFSLDAIRNLDLNHLNESFRNIFLFTFKDHLNSFLFGLAIQFCLPFLVLSFILVGDIYYSKKKKMQSSVH